MMNEVVSNLIKIYINYMYVLCTYRKEYERVIAYMATVASTPEARLTPPTTPEKICSHEAERTLNMHDYHIINTVLRHMHNNRIWKCYINLHGLIGVK